MAYVTSEFLEKWRGGRQLGGDAPRCVVQIRRGSWRRAYRAWDGADIEAIIPGEPAPIIVDYSNGTDTAIPDDTTSGAVFTFDVAETVEVEEFGFYITHTFVGDLIIKITPPDAVTRILVENNGGSATNFGRGSGSRRMKLRDDAEDSVTELDPDDAPWAGTTWRPVDSLSSIGIQDPGEWTIEVEDVAAQDQGTVRWIGMDLVVADSLGYWYPVFTETTDWEQLPNVASVEITNDFSQRGLAVATIVMENVEYVTSSGPGGDYHAIERGYFAPTRGYDPGDWRAPAGVDANAWTGKIDEMAEIRIWQGFGTPELDEGAMPLDGGTNGAWVFRGLVDDVDLTAQPVNISLVVRAGTILTDSRVFGWNKSRQLDDPITFMDAEEAAEEAAEAASLGIPMKHGEETIQVLDVSEMVKIVLRWAGFQEWDVEEAGVSLAGRFVVNRSNYLIDVITAACEQTGFVFFLADPSDGDSQGVPTFRRDATVIREPAAIAAEVKDTDLITDHRAKLSSTPRGYIIRVRGKTSRVYGEPLGGDSVERVMFVYRPPWTEDNHMAGIIKHVTHTDFKLRHTVACRAGCYLIAIAEALEAVTSVVELPANPIVELDDQVGILDTATGVNSRLWVASRTSSFVAGERVSWTMTLTGALIDSPYLVEIIDEIIDYDWPTGTVPPAVVSGTREMRIR